MPGGDRTGPRGMGPMTGGGFGYCAGNDAPGFGAGGARGAGFGRGMGGGRGMGRGAGHGRGMGGGHGYRHMYYATGLPGWQRGGAAWGAGFGAPAGAFPDAPEDAAAIRAEAQRLEETAVRLRERADALDQPEE